MLVKEIMTTEVKIVTSASTIQNAAKIMSDFNIGCLIVVDRKMLSGIITERDILRKVVAENKSSLKTKVDEVMTKEVIAIEPDAEIEDAANAMTDRQVKRLPVVSGNRIVGIVSAVDIVAAEPKMMEQIAKLVLLPVKKRLAAG